MSGNENVMRAAAQECGKTKRNGCEKVWDVPKRERVRIANLIPRTVPDVPRSDDFDSGIVPGHSQWDWDGPSRDRPAWRTYINSAGEYGRPVWAWQAGAGSDPGMAFRRQYWCLK